MASGVYNRYKAHLFNKETDWEANSIRVALMTNSHTFDADDDVWTDVSANDIGAKVVYPAGGSALSTCAVTQGVGAGATKADADNHAYGPSETLDAYYAVLWDDTASDDALVCCFDFGGVKSVSNGTLTLAWHTNGILTIT